MDPSTKPNSEKTPCLFQVSQYPLTKLSRFWKRKNVGWTTKMNYDS